MIDLQALVQVVRALRESGVTHFKCEELEITFSKEQAVVSHQNIVAPTPTQIAPLQTASQMTPTAQQQMEIDLKHQARLKDALAVLQMSPEDVMNKVFPEGANL